MNAAYTTIPQTVFAESSHQAQSFLYFQHRWLNGLAMALGDTLALCLALLTAGTIRFLWLGEMLLPGWSWLLIPVWWCGAALAGLLPSWGLGPVEELRRLTVLLLALFGGTAVALFLTKEFEGVSRFTVPSALCVCLVAVPLIRLRVKKILIAFGIWGLPTVVYGAGKTGRQVVQFLLREKGLGYMPIGVFDDNPDYWGTTLEDVRVLGGTDIVMLNTPVAVLAMPGVDRDRLIELLEGPLAQYRKVLVIPDLLGAPSLWVRPRDLDGMLGLEIKSNLMSPLARLAKRTVDILVVLLLLPLLVPLCALCVLFVWLEDRRNPFFLQERVGTAGRLFKALKLRTMVPEAEAVLRRKLDEDPALRQEWEAHYKLKNDPRLTRAGRLLRRFSLDELPQLLNVLRGEMSLVGPRPLPRYHYGTLPHRVRELRARVRPGVTGLWQVSGRSDIGTEGMERWDVYYVRNWSLWLDAVVLFRTGRAVLEGGGAY